MTKPKKSPPRSKASAFANLQALTGAQSGPLVPEFSGAVKNEKMRRQIRPPPVRSASNKAARRSRSSR
jgi:hypothetical protein